MADITAGRLDPDKNSVGGLRAVYFVNDGDATGVTYDVTDTDAIATVLGTPQAFKFNLKGANSFDQTIVSSRDAGTTFFEQNLKLTLAKLTMKDHKELKLLTWGKPQVIVEDNNGNFFYCGLKRGMEVTGGTIATGTNLGDASGYTLELKGEEPIAANFIDNTLTGAGFTIVLGT
jgi:hypothetical protein